jgi:hypothetical protein
MYLFARRARLVGGDTRKAMTFAVGITEKVNQITSLGVSLYTGVFSPEVGTLAWTAMLPDMAALEAANDKLLADDGYVSMLDEGATFLENGSVDDALSQVIYGQPDPNRTVEYATVVRAMCIPGKQTRGMELGVEIAQRIERITSTPTLFASDVTGVLGGVEWITVHPDIQSVEADGDALANDPDFGKFIDKEVANVYQGDPLPSQRLFRRLA